MSGYQELLESGNLAIADMAMKCEQVLSSHERALVSISGGADSDVMMDLCERVRHHVGCDVDYVWFNTGMEYDATKRHLDYLEDRYDVEIRRERSVKTIPVCAKEMGQPFVSKMVSQHMGILQRHDFQWEDKPLAILRMDYPDCPVSSRKWWTDAYARSHGGGYTSYCISRNKWLREFVIENPPQFRISADCCKYAKKETKRELLKTGEWDVELVGIRQAEGGVRSLHGRCFIAGGGISRRRCVPPAVLVVGLLEAGVRAKVRHQALRLLRRMGIHPHWMRRMPVQPQRLLRHRDGGGVRAEHGEGRKKGLQ